MKQKRSCRTCVYWDKPAGARAMADKAYSCSAPLPALVLPDSVTQYYAFKINLGRRWMTREEGTSCPTWQPILASIRRSVP
jgi:hypothetical protein